jgi:hypothetical protein
MKTTIFDYFDKHIEYPENIASNILPYGTLWSYVSDSILNAFINYVKPFGIYVLNRYRTEDSKVSCRVHTPGQCDWYDFNGTKIELITKLKSKQIDIYHTKLGCFDDDVIIISEITPGSYMFFWFDCDVSDCMIGRFITSDTKEQIYQSILTYLSNTCADNTNGMITEDTECLCGWNELPPDILSGWVSF